MIFLERTREGHRQSDEQWNRFSKATLGKLLRDRVERIIMGFSERIDTILN